MESFVNIPDNFSPDLDYWDLNPQHALIPPFSKLKRKHKKKSGKYMWACVFMAHPDKYKNKLYRLKVEERKKAIEENYIQGIDWDDPLLQECIEEWPKVSLDTVQRALKSELDFLEKRSDFLRTVPYNLDTMSQVDAAVSKTVKIYDNFEAIQEKYMTARRKSDTLVYGGRQETLTEKGLM